MHKLVMIFTVTLCAGGCIGRKPTPDIVEGRRFVDEANAASVKTTEAVIQELRRAYLEAETQNAERAFEADIKGLEERAKANPELATPENLMKAQLQYIQDRDARILAVRNEVNKLDAILEISRRDRELAKKIQTVLDSYADAGVDITVASAAVSQILDLVKEQKGDK